MSEQRNEHIKVKALIEATHGSAPPRKRQGRGPRSAAGC